MRPAYITLHFLWLAVFPAISSAQYLPGASPHTFGGQGASELLVSPRPGINPESLVRSGIELLTSEGRVLHAGDWVAFRGTVPALIRLAEDSRVRAAHFMPRNGIPPLDHSREILGVANGRGAGRPASEWTGAGVTILDLDSHVDVFHPDFFRGDAGYFDWIDQNEDGRFRPGEDAIDLNGNGVVDPLEIAQVLRANHFDFTEPTEGLTRPGFDPSVDWIYLDSDANGTRDFGASFGFDDEAAAFGEPLFVPDDVDGDGELGPAERLVRLGTSKFQAIYIDAGSGQRVLRRGVDLATSPADLTGGVYGYADTMHASGVLGIMAGGLALPSRRLTGIAPNADLLNGFDLTQTSGRTLWGYMQNPDVVIHEYVSWTAVALDGSDPVSMLIDESAERGVINVCPGGNIGRAEKHLRVELGDGESSDQLFAIAGGLQQLRISLHARGDGTLSADLLSPDGAVIPIEPSGFDTTEGSAARIAGSGETTSRGTQMLHAAMLEPRGAGWQVRLRATGGALTIHGMLADEQGFRVSSTWAGATDDSTLAWPATADRCIAVGSIPAHDATEGPWYLNGGFRELYQVRSYSAQGPRIDGEQRPHLVAPDNPWAPMGFGDVIPTRPGEFVAPLGSYRVFGGTSGAGPHVAGVAALLVESGVSGDAARTAMIENAIVDARTGEVPNSEYGFGRVHASASLGGATEGERPSVSLVSEPEQVLVGAAVTLRVESGAASEVRWDLDYDGEWDTEYVPIEARTESFDSVGSYRVKVRVRDGEGRFAEAAVRIEVVGELVPDMNVPDAGAGDAGTRDAGADAGVPVSEDDGCGCGTTPGKGHGLAFLALAIWCLRRRRYSVAQDNG